MQFSTNNNNMKTLWKETLIEHPNRLEMNAHIVEDAFNQEDYHAIS